MHLHRWGRWQDAEGTFHSPLFRKLGQWAGPVQVRTCAKCDKAKIREL